MIDADERPGLTTSVPITALAGTERRDKHDDLATEEPLEIRIAAGGQTRALAVTMRTPGHDFELAAGFLLSEGIVEQSAGIARISYCLDPGMPREQQYNVVTVRLAATQLPDFARFERHFVASSACGVCGKASIDELKTRALPIDEQIRIEAAAIARLPEKMRAAQRVFAATGGLHAAALFDADGTLLVLREDVGRHNAVDKIAGWALLAGRVPLHGCVLLVSGRAGYEIVQKSITARIPILCAVSAPSSLAVQTANAFGLTLLGFVRGDRANVYAGGGRVV